MQLRRPAAAFTFYPRTTNFAPGRDVSPHVGPVWSVTVTREHHERGDGVPRADHPTYWSTREEADAHAAATLDASDPRTDPEAATTPADVLDACAFRDATSVAWVVDGAPLWRISVAVVDVHAHTTARLARLAIELSGAPADPRSLAAIEAAEAPALPAGAEEMAVAAAAAVEDAPHRAAELAALACERALCVRLRPADAEGYLRGAADDACRAAYAAHLRAERLAGRDETREGITATASAALARVRAILPGYEDRA